MCLPPLVGLRPGGKDYGAVPSRTHAQELLARRPRDHHVVNAPKEAAEGEEHDLVRAIAHDLGQAEAGKHHKAREAAEDEDVVGGVVPLDRAEAERPICWDPLHAADHMENFMFSARFGASECGP